MRATPPDPSSPTLRGGVARVLAIGAVALLGAAALHGRPDPAAVRRSACAVAVCASPTPAPGAAPPATGALTAGRPRPDDASWRLP